MRFLPIRPVRPDELSGTPSGLTSKGTTARSWRARQSATSCGVVAVSAIHPAELARPSGHSSGGAMSTGWY
ncbi:hypothetical protein [Nocardiopsis dassonvillei]|uniref:hypothetical protein n=1 Tax=Nocardiopsis dassonvillei TaxID=2014 RepID=UPI00366BCA24